MSKEAREEAMAATNNNGSSSPNDGYAHAILKGKRTKRMRLLQVLAPAAAAASSASSSGELSGSTTTEEEEDMANCLILLAQGRASGGGTRSQPWPEEEGGGEGSEKFFNRRSAEAATANNGKVGLCAYECKTCNKCFPSFQALGGHRASHKKPKTLQAAAAAAAAAEEKRAMDEDSLQISIASYPKINILPNNGSGRTITPPFNNNNNVVTASHNKPRVHECSICGSEFSSGQALGGHMRRHRPATTAPEPQEAKKERSILSLDLNLPAPSDDGRADFPRSPSFPFSGKRPLIFSASALVDCHY